MLLLAAFEGGGGFLNAMASMQLEAALWCPYPSGSRQMAALVRHDFIKQFRNSSGGVPLGYMDCGHAASYWLCRVDASPGVTLCAKPI